MSRGIARILVPLTFLAIATSAWADPDLASQLAKGLQTLHPTMASLLSGTPLESVVGSVLNEDLVWGDSTSGDVSNPAVKLQTLVSIVQP